MVCVDPVDMCKSLTLSVEMDTPCHLHCSGYQIYSFQVLICVIVCRRLIMSVYLRMLMMTYIRNILYNCMCQYAATMTSLQLGTILSFFKDQRDRVTICRRYRVKSVTLVLLYDVTQCESSFLALSCYFAFCRRA